MVTTRWFSRYGILIAAIGISLAWHLFWLSAVKIVAAPEQQSPVKFTKVSFLGQILTKVAMQVSAQPNVPSYLEKRYADSLGKLQSERPGANRERLKGTVLDGGFAAAADERLKGFVDAAVSGEKTEPQYGAGD